MNDRLKELKKDINNFSKNGRSSEVLKELIERLDSIVTEYCDVRGAK